MTGSATPVINRPAWVDLSSTDPVGSREFYTKVFGWNIEVNPDPQYGGYALARIDGKDVTGIGGTVVAPAFDVGDQGKMAVFQDPSGAFISAWQTSRMGGFGTHGAANTFHWAELNARGVDKVVPFYRDLFGWTTKSMGDASQPYTEFHVDGKRVGGAMEMNPMVPAEMPSYWLVYFGVEDIDRAHRTAIGAGAREMMAPQDFPGGRFSIVTDPQGAAFGLLHMATP